MILNSKIERTPEEKFEVVDELGTQTQTNCTPINQPDLDRQSPLKNILVSN